MPQACVTMAGLVFGVTLAALYHHMHMRELARVIGEWQRAQDARADANDAREACVSELAALRRQVLPLPAPVLYLPNAITSPDLFLRNLGGSPNEDPPQTQRYLLSLTVGVKQKAGVHAIITKFDLAAFTVVLFHYDGQLDAWRDLPWFNSTIHICAHKQSKWWFARRFLVPAVVSRYSHIWLWDEDIGVADFDPNRYMQIVQLHGLDISQPAISSGPVSWPITRRMPGSVLHRGREEDATSPCVEVMVPVFSMQAWRCVWAMLQNDLVHAFGLDLAWHVCAAGNRTVRDSMAVIDEQCVEHLGAPTLGESGGQHESGQPTWLSVYNRRLEEWKIWQARWDAAQHRADAAASVGDRHSGGRAAALQLGT